MGPHMITDRLEFRPPTDEQLAAVAEIAAGGVAFRASSDIATMASLETPSPDEQSCPTGFA